MRFYEACLLKIILVCILVAVDSLIFFFFFWSGERIRLDLLNQVLLVSPIARWLLSGGFRSQVHPWPLSERILCPFPPCLTNPSEAGNVGCRFFCLCGQETIFHITSFGWKWRCVKITGNQGSLIKREKTFEDARKPLISSSRDAHE